MKNIILFTLSLFTTTGISLQLWANTDHRDSFHIKPYIEISAGAQIGGTMPYQLPNSIRTIANFSPKTPYYIGVNLVHPINHKWSTKIGLELAGKGMYTEAEVKGYETSFSSGTEQEVQGFYYGTISTQMKNIYFNLPINIQYETKHFHYYGGIYLGIAVQKHFSGEAIQGYIRESNPTGEKVGLQHVAYDFKKDISTMNFGLQLGVQYKISNLWKAQMQISHGLNNTLKSDFKSVTFPMHHTYLGLGINYNIGL